MIIKEQNVKELVVHSFCSYEWSDDFIRQIATNEEMPGKDYLDSCVFLLVKNLDAVGTDLNYLPNYFGLDEWYETEYMFSNILKYMKFHKVFNKFEKSMKIIEKRRDYLKEHNLFCEVKE